MRDLYPDNLTWSPITLTCMWIERDEKPYPQSILNLAGFHWTVRQSTLRRLSGSNLSLVDSIHSSTHGRQSVEEAIFRRLNIPVTSAGPMRFLDTRKPTMFGRAIPYLSILLYRRLPACSVVDCDRPSPTSVQPLPVWHHTRGLKTMWDLLVSTFVSGLNR